MSAAWVGALLVTVVLPAAILVGGWLCEQSYRLDELLRKDES